MYAQFMNKHTMDAGYGGLMSIVVDEGYCAKTFYNTLKIQKGPSLGTNYTLACPYTLIAHYEEMVRSSASVLHFLPDPPHPNTRPARAGSALPRHCSLPPLDSIFTSPLLSSKS